MPLLSSHPVYRQVCRSVHRKSDSKPICLHANKSLLSHLQFHPSVQTKAKRPISAIYL